MGEESGNSTMCNYSDEYKFTAYNVVYSLVFILGLVSNAGALYVFLKLSIKNRLSTIILIHLAISDLVFIFTLPFRLGYYLRESARLASTDRGLPTKHDPDTLDMACRVSTYLFYISMYCSIYFLTALSMCRYLVLSGRLRYQNQVYCRRVRLLCLGIWAFVVGGNVIYITVLDGFQLNVYGCFEPLSPDTWDFLHQVNLVVVVIGFGLPLLMVLLCYVLMIRHILRARSGRRGRDVALVCLVLLVFCVCFLPYHVLRTLHLQSMMQPEVSCSVVAALHRGVVATMCFAATNSCLDPLIFLFVGNGFMRVVQDILGAWGLRRRNKSSGLEIRGPSCGGRTIASPTQQPMMTKQQLDSERSPSDSGDSTVL